MTDQISRMVHNVKLILWGYSHDQYLYSRVFGGEEFISDNKFKDLSCYQYKSKMAAIYLHYGMSNVGICASVVLTKV